MDVNPSETQDQDGGVLCEIRVARRLDARWAMHFPGFSLRVVGAETVLVGRVVDDAALFAVLTTIRDLALPLSLVARPADASRPTSWSDKERRP